MDARIEEVILECTQGSDEERLSFPQVVGKLIEAGIERYHADLLGAVKTYYTERGALKSIGCHELDVAPALAFDAPGIEQAVRAIQRGQIAYREFCRRIAKAGCVGYHVSMSGRRAVYYGRTLETHVELFPAAK